MREVGERAALLEEAFQAGIEAAAFRVRKMRVRFAVGAQGERCRQVLLDDDRRFVLVVGEIDEGEPAGCQDTEDAIVFEPAANLQWQVQLHGRYDSE